MTERCLLLNYALHKMPVALPKYRRDSLLEANETPDPAAWPMAACAQHYSARCHSTCRRCPAACETRDFLDEGLGALARLTVHQRRRYRPCYTHGARWLMRHQHETRRNTKRAGVRRCTMTGS